MVKVVYVFLVCLLVFAKSYGQTTGWVLDTNGEPIKYASVLLLSRSQKGTTTQENGCFSFRESVQGYLYISAVGYYDTIVPVSAFVTGRNEIKLRTRIYELEEVLVVSENTESVVIGPLNIQPNDDGWKRERPGEQTGIFYKPRNKERHKKITTVRLYISEKGCPNSSMGLRLLSYLPSVVKENKKIPIDDLKDLLPELVTFQAEKPGWIDIDLSGYNIRMPENGLLVLAGALDKGEKFQWQESGKYYYGAMISNASKAYSAYKLVLSTPASDHSTFYVVDSPLLRNAKPMIVIMLE